jgi:exopolyphosphatase/guanosine-5'-triphosphate,3'-diphosphate pyrophosphatase
MKLGLLDIGSTAARLELVDLDRDTLPRAEWSSKSRTHLAEHTLPDGFVLPEGVDSAVRAVEKCLRTVDGREPDALVPYGTSAVRDAANCDELRERLSAAVGQRIGVLSPEVEAALTYRAAHRWHGRPPEVITTVDVGGGTTDVVRGTGQEPDQIASLPLGAARLTRQYLGDDPPNAAQVEELTAAVRERTRAALKPFASGERGEVLAQSKMLRQLAVLAESTEQRVARHPDRLIRSGVVRWLPRLAELDQHHRAALPGISRSRARRVLAGAIVVDAVLDELGADSAEVCPWGLREGLVFRFVEACEGAGSRGAAVREVVAEMFA